MRFLKPPNLDSLEFYQDFLKFSFTKRPEVNKEYNKEKFKWNARRVNENLISNKQAALPNKLYNMYFNLKENLSNVKWRR